METTSFESPHYIPITRSDFDTIEIDIKNETGGEATFSIEKANFILIIMVSTMFEDYYTN